MTPAQFKEARQKLGLTQTGLARELGLSSKNARITISRIENGSYDNPERLIANLKTLLALRGLD